jgi:hypothetical protein
MLRCGVYSLLVGKPIAEYPAVGGEHAMVLVLVRLPRPPSANDAVGGAIGLVGDLDVAA